MSLIDKLKEALPTLTAGIITTSRMAACGQNYFSTTKLLDQLISYGFKTHATDSTVYSYFKCAVGTLGLVGAALVIGATRGPKTIEQCDRLFDFIYKLNIYDLKIFETIEKYHEWHDGQPITHAQATRQSLANIANSHNLLYINHSGDVISDEDQRIEYIEIESRRHLLRYEFDREQFDPERFNPPKPSGEINNMILLLNKYPIYLVTSTYRPWTLPFVFGFSLHPESILNIIFDESSSSYLIVTDQLLESSYFGSHPIATFEASNINGFTLENPVADPAADEILPEEEEESTLYFQTHNHASTDRLAARVHSFIDSSDHCDPLRILGNSFAGIASKIDSRRRRLVEHLPENCFNEQGMTEAGEQALSDFNNTLTQEEQQKTVSWPSLNESLLFPYSHRTFLAQDILDLATYPTLYPPMAFCYTLGQYFGIGVSFEKLHIPDTAFANQSQWFLSLSTTMAFIFFSASAMSENLSNFYGFLMCSKSAWPEFDNKFRLSLTKAIMACTAFSMQAFFFSYELLEKEGNELNAPKNSSAWWAILLLSIATTLINTFSTRGVAELKASGVLPSAQKPDESSLKTLAASIAYHAFAIFAQLDYLSTWSSYSLGLVTFLKKFALPGYIDLIIENSHPIFLSLLIGCVVFTYCGANAHKLFSIIPAKQKVLEKIKDSCLNNKSCTLFCSNTSDNEESPDSDDDFTPLLETENPLNTPLLEADQHLNASLPKDGDHDNFIDVEEGINETQHSRSVNI